MGETRMLGSYANNALLRVALLGVLLAGCAAPLPSRPDLDSRLADIGLRPAENIEQLPRAGLESWQYLSGRQLLLIARDATYLLRTNADCQLQPNSQLRLGGQTDSFAVGDSLWIDALRVCRVEQLSRLEKAGEPQ